MPPALNPLTWSDSQFNLLLYILLAAPLFPAVFLCYCLHLTAKIESTREELSEN